MHDESRRLRGSLRREPAFGYGSEEVLVLVLTLDERVSPDTHIAVIHLDVEGHKQQALWGVLGLVHRWKPTVVLETAPDPSWMAEHLAVYRVTSTVDRRNAVLTHRHWSITGTLRRPLASQR